MFSSNAVTTGANGMATVTYTAGNGGTVADLMASFAPLRPLRAQRHRHLTELARQPCIKRRLSPSEALNGSGLGKGSAPPFATG
jgi:hypothetical protein